MGAYSGADPLGPGLCAPRVGGVILNEPAVRVEGLVHTYPTREGPLAVLQDVSLLVDRGGYVSLMGSSGSGKSTLLAILGGLEKPQSGQVFVGGTDLHGLARDELAKFRRKTVGFVFQHFGLLEALTAQENVELALMYNGVPAGARHRKAKELLGDVGLAARVSHRPHELSGGERQRVAIARAIANGPRPDIGRRADGQPRHRCGRVSRPSPGAAPPRARLHLTGRHAQSRHGCARGNPLRLGSWPTGAGDR